jgi:pyruvate,water dikinase
MPMIRSDKASSGVIFTLDTETGFRDAVVVSGSYGLGEFIVQGVVTPDEWTVFKPTLLKGHRAIIGRRLGTKEVRLVYGDGSRTTRSEATPPADRASFSLNDDEVLKLAKWACIIETYYSGLAGHAQAMSFRRARKRSSHRNHDRPRPRRIGFAASRVSLSSVARPSARKSEPVLSMS